MRRFWVHIQRPPEYTGLPEEGGVMTSGPCGGSLSLVHGRKKRRNIKKKWRVAGDRGDEAGLGRHWAVEALAFLHVVEFPSRPVTI